MNDGTKHSLRGWTVVTTLVAALVACSGTSGTAANDGKTGATDGASSGPPSCEALCAHIEAVTCEKPNAAPHADCMKRCGDLQARPECKAQSDALIGCCQKADLSAKCSDNVLDPRDCNDDDVCKAEGDALEGC